MEEHENWNWKDDEYHSIIPPERGLTGPIYTSIAYGFTKADEAAAVFDGKPGYAYPRIACGTPPVHQLSQKILDLELEDNKLRNEYDVLLTASGMSATAMLILALADNFRSIVSSPYLYGGTYHLFEEFLPRLGIECVMIDDPTNLDSWRRGIYEARNPVCLFAEDDANPMLIKINNREVANLAHHHNLLYICDRTVGTPILEKPIISKVPKYRTDIVVHSLSKNICGRSWALGGAIVARKELIEKIRNGYFAAFGPVLDPRAADRILYSMRDLKQRIQIKLRNSEIIAEWLTQHPKVVIVYGPRCDLISFELEGELKNAQRVVESYNHIIFAPHLGHIRTLSIHPASTTHCKVPKDKREKMGMTDTLIRLSIGIEDPYDVIDDLDQAIGRAYGG